MDRMRICGIMVEHGENDFGYWNGFNLTEEEEDTIWEILSKHDTEGCSVRGTLEEVIEDIK
jgi:hypothetical protein